MRHDYFTDEVWVPVNIKGFGTAFEMCPLGFVRCVKADRHGARLWLLPVDGEHGPAYHLSHAGAEAELIAGDIVALFGGDRPVHAEWGATLRRKALVENARLRGVSLERAICDRIAGGADGLSVDALLQAASARCPWAGAEVSGDAMGADPVLGY